MCQCIYLLVLIMESNKLTALVFGGTGAIGQLLVKELSTSTRWGKVICVGRKGLPEWGSHNKI